MNPRTHFVFVASALVCAAIGFTYASLVEGDPATGSVVGLAIGASILGFELYLVQGSLGRRLRRQRLVVLVLLTTVVWGTCITVSLLVVPTLMLGQAYGPGYTATTFSQDLLVALLVCVLFNATLRVRTLIGPRVLGNFLLGRYYRPLREERVFMFLDLADSTAIAERLGDRQTQALIGDFFFDIAAPIARWGGETHRYIGDEVVVTWPLARALERQACLRCVQAIEAVIHRRARYYERRYRTVPRYRIGLHAGSVVASEIGDEKREIVYFGDTINTAARIGSQCKVLARQCIISDDLLRLLGPGLVAEDLGEVHLAGKEAPVRLWAIASSGPGG